jgi:hypothetical protein
MQRIQCLHPACLSGGAARPRAVVSRQRRGAATRNALVPWAGGRRGGGCCARAPRGADAGDPALHYGRHELTGWPPGGVLPPPAGAAPCRRTAWPCCPRHACPAAEAASVSYRLGPRSASGHSSHCAQYDRGREDYLAKTAAEFAHLAFQYPRQRL